MHFKAAQRSWIMRSNLNSACELSWRNEEKILSKQNVHCNKRKKKEKNDLQCLLTSQKYSIPLEWTLKMSPVSWKLLKHRNYALQHLKTDKYTLLRNIMNIFLGTVLARSATSIGTGKRHICIHFCIHCKTLEFCPVVISWSSLKTIDNFQHENCTSWVIISSTKCRQV